MDELTIAYLSWKRQDILEQTLESHKINGLFDIIPEKNRIIFFQEISGNDIITANKYNLNVLGSTKNIGVLDAFIELVEKCKTKYFLFSENDWLLTENKDVCKNTIDDCIQIIDNGKEGTCIKLRHRINPGMPNALSYWKSLYIDKKEGEKEYDDFCYKLHSLHWLEEPHKFYKPGTLNELQYNYKWYSTTLKHESWSTNAYIVNTEFLKNVVVPLLKETVPFWKPDHRNLSFNYLGLENILVHYKNYYGKSEKLDSLLDRYGTLELVAGRGLFTHKDTVIKK
jgi:hypothetical protein